MRRFGRVLLMSIICLPILIYVLIHDSVPSQPDPVTRNSPPTIWSSTTSTTRSSSSSSSSTTTTSTRPSATSRTSTTTTTTTTTLPLTSAKKSATPTTIAATTRPRTTRQKSTGLHKSTIPTTPTRPPITSRKSAKPTTNIPIRPPTSSGTSTTSTSTRTATTKMLSTKSTTSTTSTTKTTTSSTQMPTTELVEPWLDCPKSAEAADWKSEPKGKAATYAEILTRFTAFMKRTGMPIMLAHGTLLGWLRHCDFIPHTPDLDFAAPISQVTPEWLKLMESLSDPYLDIRIGWKAADSLELSFRLNDTKVDLFFLYPLPGFNGFFMPGAGYMSGHGWHDMLQWQFPLSKPMTVCRSKIRGAEVRLPCNAEEMVVLEYGPNWKKPVKQWTWHKSPSNIKKVRTVKANLYNVYSHPKLNVTKDEILIQEYIDKFL